MKINLLILLGCLFCVQTSFSQNVSDYAGYNDKYKDLVYLNLKTEVFVDIGKTGLKIEETKYEDIYYTSYKAGAYSEGKVESSQFYKMKDIEACTLFPENNKYKEIKVKDFKTKEVFDEDVFYQDSYSTSFIYPSLRQGAITKLKYKIDVTEPHFFPYEIVQRYYPVENFEFIINSDKDVEFGTKYFFTDSSNIDFKKEAKGNRFIYTWKAKNIKSYKSETRSREYMCYLPQIIPYIKSYILNNGEVTVFRNVDDLFTWENSNVSKIDHQHTDAMKETVNTLVKDCKTDMEKATAIYLWVQKNIKYVANEYGQGGFVPRNPYQIFDKRYGDCKDMATIIVELLDIAGVKAYYTWIGTRDLPYSYEDIPTSRVTNHMIAAYIENGKYYFLDATNHYLPITLPSSFIQGKECMIRFNNDKYEIHTVPEVPADTNVHNDYLNLTLDQGKIKGKGYLLFKGYYFTNMLENIDMIKDGTEKAKYIKSYLETGNNKCEIDKYEIIPSANDLRINYEFTLTDHLIINNNEMYLNLNLMQPYKDFELFTKDRQLDYEFYFKSLLNLTYIFAIPDGYEVSYLPKNTSYTNDDFSYSITYEIKGNTVIYHYTTKATTMLLKPPVFESWNKMVRQMRTDYKEVVELKKKI